MANINYWEKRFVDAYVVPEKVERYLLQLKGEKHRKKILERLNHSLDFRPETATVIPQERRTDEKLLALLGRQHVEMTCQVIADGHVMAGQEMRVERAIDEMLSHPFGFLMICPPAPIAIYKQEDIGEMFLLKPAH